EAPGVARRALALEAVEVLLVRLQAFEGRLDREVLALARLHVPGLHPAREVSVGGDLRRIAAGLVRPRPHEGGLGRDLSGGHAVLEAVGGKRARRGQRDEHAGEHERDWNGFAHSRLSSSKVERHAEHTGGAFSGTRRLKSWRSPRAPARFAHTPRTRASSRTLRRRSARARRSGRSRCPRPRSGRKARTTCTSTRATRARAASGGCGRSRCSRRWDGGPVRRRWWRSPAG